MGSQPLRETLWRRLCLLLGGLASYPCNLLPLLGTWRIRDSTVIQSLSMTHTHQGFNAKV